jgi:hypothetical protein
MDFTNAEFKVICFVFDRTMAYKHWTEAIPYSHFMHGVHLIYDGSLHSPGTEMGESSLKNAIRGLVQKQVLVRVKNTKPYGTLYAINTRWYREEFGPLWDVFHPDELYPVDQVEKQPRARKIRVGNHPSG